MTTQREVLEQAAPAVLSATQMRALQDARTTAMHWTAKARVPECGEFGRIAQDLDWLVNELAAPQQKVQYAQKLGVQLSDLPLDTLVYTAQPAPQQEVREPVAWLPSSEWVACTKLPVTVHVRQQRPGETHVSTREGITPIKPDDLIIRGVAGEEYPIGKKIFEKTYRIGNTSPQPVHKRTVTYVCPVCAASLEGKK